MNRNRLSLVWGILLLGLGVLLLLQNLNVLGAAWQIFWALLFAAGGASLLVAFLGNRNHWWAVVPGFVLLALGALIGLEALDRELASIWGGSLFLGAFALGFLTIYATRREAWWALIPGGVMLTLALIAGLARLTSGSELGAVFFLGLGLTFGLLYFLPIPRGRQTWASIPAVLLTLFGLALFGAATSLLSYFWPVALILLGLFLLYRTLQSEHSYRPSPEAEGRGEPGGEIE